MCSSDLVTLFAALTGKLPYEFGADAQILAAHVKAPIPTFAERNPGCRSSPAVESVVRKAMAKEPADRPASVGALAKWFRLAAEQSAAPATMMIPALAAATTRVSEPHATPAPRPASPWPIVVVVASLACGILIGALMAH